MTYGTGISRYGKGFIDPIQRLEQSIDDILTTPLGSRIGQGDYGSFLFELLDQPMGPTILQQIRAATIDAIARWEPDYSVSDVSFIQYNGHLAMKLTGRAYSQNVAIDLSIPQRNVPS